MAMISMMEGVFSRMLDERFGCPILVYGEKKGAERETKLLQTKQQQQIQQQLQNSKAEPPKAKQVTLVEDWRMAKSKPKVKKVEKYCRRRSR